MDSKQEIRFRNPVCDVNSDLKKTIYYSGDSLSNQFNLVSATLSNFLPSLPYSRHEEIFQGVRRHQHLSIQEQENPRILEETIYEGRTPELERRMLGSSMIYSTFHTGSYRLINLLLTKLKIPFNVVIARNVILDQGNTLQFLHQQQTQTGGHYFNIIDAEQPCAALKMMKELIRGHSLVVYMDGNTGSGESSAANANCCQIQFLQQQIFARLGAGFLAHTCQTPILPVASYRTFPDQITLKFFDLILPDHTSTKREFSERTTQHLYDLISPIIETYPEQWEGWLYLHKVASRTPVIQTAETILPTSDLLSFNPKRFGIFKMGQQAFLLRKRSYSLYEIPGELYSILAESLTCPFARKEISYELLTQFLAEGVLVDPSVADQ